MTSPLPTNLSDSIPDALIGDAERWWHSLNDDDRCELTSLCDSRREVFLFETFSGEDAPKVSGGKFIPHDNAFGINDWGEDYFQHLLDHPELIIVFEPKLRTFHIGCSRHADARRCFVDGGISNDFKCPYGVTECLMHKMLRERNSLELRPIPVRKSKMRVATE